MKEEQRVIDLFKNQHSKMVLSCLQGIMGYIIVDDEKDPTPAVACVGDFSYFVGKPNKIIFEIKNQKDQRVSSCLVPENKDWEKAIQDNYGSQVVKTSRYAMKANRTDFDIDRLRSIVKSLNPEYQLRKIDKQTYNKCLEKEWSSDLVSQFSSYEVFKDLGLGYVIYCDGEIVSGASTYIRYLEGIEIEIDTDKEFRKHSLALRCGAALILECLTKNLFPHWDAYDLRSVRLAKRLGYDFDYEYVVFNKVED